MSEIILEQDLNSIIKYNFINYAEEVSSRRALPAASDGLKPVTRRVLFSMNDLGLAYDLVSEVEKPYKKCARIVGDTMGKYHPHGDSSIYGALVTAAQDFRNSCSLISGYGNFGSWDDGAAAMRYTEARLSQYGTILLDGINKECIPFQNNFDDTEVEPIKLPALIPNLLINGEFGISVGYSCNIPPHNVTECCDVFIWRLQNPKGTLDEALKILKGPDFPSYAQIDPTGLKECYETGKGKFYIRGTLETEQLPKGKFAIIATSLPFAVKPEAFMSKVATVFSDPKYDFYQVENSSSKDGFEIRMVFGKDGDVAEIVKTLYEKTDLQCSYSYNFLTTINDRPACLPLLPYLDYLVEEKTIVMQQMIEFDLRKAKRDLLIIEAKLLVGNHSQEIVDIMRKSDNASKAAITIASTFDISNECAKIITEMRLFSLTKQEVSKLTNTKKELNVLIKKLTTILKTKANIQQELVNRIEHYKELVIKPRRTKIKKFTAMDLKESSSGDFILQAINDSYNVLSASSKAKTGLLLPTKSGNTILSIMEDGKFVKFHGNNLRTSETSNMIFVNNIEENDHMIFCVASNGQVQKNVLELYNSAKENKLFDIMKLSPTDRLVKVFEIEKDMEIVLETKNGMAIRFSTEDVRNTGLNTGGMRGINLEPNDSVINAYVDLKKCKIPLQKRGGKGVKNKK